MRIPRLAFPVMDDTTYEPPLITDVDLDEGIENALPGAGSVLR